MANKVETAIELKQMFITERTRIISEMLDNPDELGIYRTGRCYEEFNLLYDKIVRLLLSSGVDRMPKDTDGSKLAKEQFDDRNLQVAFLMGFEACRSRMKGEGVALPGDPIRINDWSKKYDTPWVCDFCSEKFDFEVDLLSHQFNSHCKLGGEGK